MALFQKENILKTVSYFLMGVRNGITNVRQFGLLAFAVIGLVSFSIFYWFQEIDDEGWQGFKQAQIWKKLGLARTVEDELNQPSLPIPLIDIEVLPGQMQRHILRQPEGVCQLIEEQGFNTEGWKGSRIGWSGWECLADFELKVDGKIKASAFFSMRGNAPDRITTLRLKFNLPQPGNGRKAYANMLAERSLIPLFDYFRWTFPHDLREKIRDLSPIETVMDGVEVNLFEEYDSAQFVHLLLTMPKEELPFVVSDGKVRSIFVARKLESKEQPKRLRPVGSRRQVVDFSKPLRRDEEGIIIPDDIDDDEFGNPSLPVVEPAGEGEIVEVDAIDSIEKDDEISERQVGKEKSKPVRKPDTDETKPENAIAKTQTPDISKLRAESRDLSAEKSAVEEDQMHLTVGASDSRKSEPTDTEKQAALHSSETEKQIKLPDQKQAVALSNLTETKARLDLSLTRVQHDQRELPEEVISLLGPLLSTNESSLAMPLLKHDPLVDGPYRQAQEGVYSIFSADQLAPATATSKTRTQTRFNFSKPDDVFSSRSNSISDIFSRRNELFD